MVLVLNQPLTISHRSVLISKATAFYFLCFLLTFIPPLLVAYRSQGFWKKIDSYEEQAEIHFKHELIVLLETQNLDRSIAWSTDKSFNLLMQDQARVPSIKSHETDWNRDGIKDGLDLEIKMPLANDENIYGIKLFVFFDVNLKLFSMLNMEGMAFVGESCGLPASKVDVVGDLRLVQKEPLMHKGRDNRYSQPTLLSSRNGQPYEDKILAEKFKFSQIIRNYNQRNVSMKMSNDYVLWERGSNAGMPFVANMRINYPVQTITYRPGFWQMIKWAWMQYLAVLVIFVYIFKSVKEFVFTNKILSTRTTQQLTAAAAAAANKL